VNFAKGIETVHAIGKPLARWYEDHLGIPAN
jgi:hypothetical protein